MEQQQQIQQKTANLQPIQAKPPGGMQQSANPILAKLIHLAVAALGAETPEQAGSVIVNRIHTLIKTDRAMLVPIKDKKKRILCISGDLDPAKGQDNPYAEAVHEMRKVFRKEPNPQIITQENLDEELKVPNTRKVLESVGGTSVLWFPLLMAGNQESGFVLWLERWNNKPWGQEEIKLLSHASMFFGHALSDPRGKREEKEGKKKKWWKKLLSFPLFLLLVSMIPMKARISSPIEVVPDRPHYVFAPFDGIMEELEVQPGEHVKNGALLFRYDTRVLEKQLEEARQGVAVTLAELARLEGAGYEDKDARAKIPVQKIEVARAEAEAVFLEKQLELSEVKAGETGVVILDEPDSLVGAPLQTGQLVLRIADPKRTKLSLMVPAADAGTFKVGDEVTARVDSNPLDSYSARLTWVGFEVKLSKDKGKKNATPIPSIMAEAEWLEDPPVIPGQLGRAHITGRDTVLGLVWFRRPLARWRDRFGKLGI